MSGKLDKPLDDIVSARRKSAGNRRPQRRSTGYTATAPAGGIHKTKAPVRGAAAKGAQGKGAGPQGESKVIVSNLPKDVSEQQIKEYFVQSVGPIKRVELSYGPNSQSRGIANVIFHKPDGASKAFQKLNGLLVDGRPIKIEIVVGAAQADKVIPPIKSLAERATQPKAQPKSAAAGKQGNGAGKDGAKGKGGRPARRGRNSRPIKKTATELDADMDNYMADSAAVTAPAAAPAANGDSAMADEISVSKPFVEDD
ncbi:RNA recognition motif domain protein [Cordyceps fumosorosea ARSEF 2679]|uniref:RNA recognition motif domain protein n=1 Tax=Cordyceps fumosorosea (strain ARSEF 2679) TaxID=1081104 RepID=A0A167W0E1_CORFA|nr:RNA recognition motif domain protein [Cordyceps fumosorosea ARSEF 2679]OAA63178.1 RNA recognition motif domain protein [Cordyceps fumosorosea ARSEF 2679]